MIVQLHASRIRDVAEGVGKGHFQRLDLPMGGESAVPLRKIELLQDVQGHQGGDALAVGRDLADLIAPVIHPDGLHPLRRIGRQILIAEVAAIFPALGIDLPGQGAPVEALPFRLADLPEGVGVIRQADQFPCLRRTALGRKSAKPGGKAGLGEPFPVDPVSALPGLGQVCPTGPALPGIALRGGEVFRQAPPPEALCDGRPGAHGAGHRHRRPAVAGHFAVQIPVLREDLFRIGQHGRGAAGVEAKELVLLFAPDEGKGVGAQAVGGGLHHRESRGGGHSRVHGVAALPQGLQPGGGRLGRGAVHHPAPGIEGKTLGGIALGQWIKLLWHGRYSFPWQRRIRLLWQISPYRPSATSP